MSIIIVDSIFITWDYIATARGDWSFNHEYITGIFISNLPLEEILFFITVPYSIIFLYEVMEYYLENKQIPGSCRMYTYIGGFLIVSSFLYAGQYYTLTVLIVTGLVFIAAPFINSKLFSQKLYWIFIVLSFLPFLIVDFLLTWLPIVRYNEHAIWGLRLITIPLEDFLYSFSLNSLYLLFYLMARDRWLKKK